MILGSTSIYLTIRHNDVGIFVATARLGSPFRLSGCLFLHVCASPSICICLTSCLCSLSVCLSFSLSFYVYICLSVRMPTYLFYLASLSIHPPVFIYVYTYLHVCIIPFIRPSLYPSIHLAPSISIYFIYQCLSV